MTVTIRRDNGKVHVRSPYDSEFVKRARALGGTWERPAWVFDARYEDRVRELCREIYGTDGAPTPTCTVRVHLDALAFNSGRISSNELKIGGISLLRKYDRDRIPTVQNGAVVIAGRLHERGGSRNNPAITFEEGTILEATNVPRALAERCVSGDPEAYQIIEEEEKEKEGNLTPEETSLLIALRQLEPARRDLLLAQAQSELDEEKISCN